MLREQNRDTWAGPIAVWTVLLHGICCLIVSGWLYYLVPIYKWRLDHADGEISMAAIHAIRMSDSFVNYWYVYALIAFGGLVRDYLMHHWITRQLGCRWAVLTVVAVGLVILSPVILGAIALKEAMSRLNNIPG